jgi:predicted dehydrogenase
MRVLVIGTGSIGQRHINNICALCPHATFDVLLREGRNKDSIDLGFDFTVSVSLEQAMSKNPELMIIANPSSLHFQYILAAIKYSIPFYLEKPILSSRSDIDELKEILLTCALPPHIIGCNLRFLPSMIALKTLIEDGVLGKIVHASFEAGQWLPDWRPSKDYRHGYGASKELGGGVSLDLIHEVDAARWLLGDIEKIQAQLWHGSRLEIETEDCACMLLKSKHGPIATVQVDYVSRQAFRRYRIVGDSATAEWDLPSKTLTLSTADGKFLHPLEESAFDVNQTYITAMKELFSAMQTGQSTSQPLSEGIASLEIILQARGQ